MRTTRDRIRHTLLFEALGLILVTPLGALAFDMPIEHIGVVGIGSATIAMLWNYLYNHGFDRLLQRWRGNTSKTLPVRVVHAIAFELGLVVTLMPLLAWYLDISLGQALVMDLAFALFYMAYAFIFNLLYDRAFPLPAQAHKTGTG